MNATANQTLTDRAISLLAEIAQSDAPMPPNMNTLELLRREDADWIVDLESGERFAQQTDYHAFTESWLHNRRHFGLCINYCELATALLKVYPERKIDADNGDPNWQTMQAHARHTFVLAYAKQLLKDVAA